MSAAAELCVFIKSSRVESESSLEADNDKYKDQKHISAYESLNHYRITSNLYKDFT